MLLLSITLEEEPRRRRCVAVGFGAGAAPLGSGGVSAASPEVGCGAAVGGRDVAGGDVDREGAGARWWRRRRGRCGSGGEAACEAGEGGGIRSSNFDLLNCTLQSIIVAIHFRCNYETLP